jgi:hypothetical protein
MVGWGEERFGGLHTSGFMAVMCDGSVRGVRYTVDLTQFARLGNRMDGQPVNVD